VPAPGSRRARSSNDPTNQEVTSKSRDTPIHSLDYSVGDEEHDGDMFS
jgi:hypothetical protein